MDWTLIINWILQGLILAGFIVLGLYVGARLIGWRPPASTDEPASPQSLEKSEPPAAPAPSIVAGATHAVAPTAASTPEAKPEKREESEAPEVRHAVDFDESGRMTLVMEMPVEMLDDDGSLVSVWIEAVSMARRERLARPRRGRRRRGRSTPEAVPIGPDNLQQQLDQVLYRLQLSAERRRKLRTMLEDAWSEEKPK